MTPQAACAALEGILAGALLVGVVYGPWQWVWIDWARQRMFDRRDQLFDMARNGTVSFSSPEYVVARESINEMIRFAHSLTWTRIVLLGFAMKFKRAKTGPTVSTTPMSVQDDVTRSQIQALVDDVSKTAIKLIVIRSPLLVSLSLLLIVPALLFRYATAPVAGLLRAFGEVIQFEARVVNYQALQTISR